MRTLLRWQGTNCTTQNSPDGLNRVFFSRCVQPCPGRGHRGFPGVSRRPGRGAAWPLLHHTRCFPGVRYHVSEAASAPNAPLGFDEAAGWLNASTDAASPGTSSTAAPGIPSPKATNMFASTTRAALAAESVAACGLADGAPHQGVVHYAVVGAGLAGVATAWQLMRRSPKDRPVVVDLYDAAGIAAGGSGAAAGLLHPYNPRGKLLWRGEEAMATALELVAAAEAAVGIRPHDAAAEAAVTAAGDPPRLEPGSNALSPQTSPPPSGERSLGNEAAGPPPTGQLRDAEVHVPASPASCTAGSHLQEGRFVWPCGMVRPAANQKQATDFVKAVGAAGAASCSEPEEGMARSRADGRFKSKSTVRILSAVELQALVPGLMVPSPGATRDGGGGAAMSSAAPSAGGAGRSDGGQVGGASRKARRAAARAAAASGTEVAADVAGLYIPEGVVLDVGQYLRALWRACQVEAESRGDGSSARLRYERVGSLERLRWAAPMGECSRAEEAKRTPLKQQQHQKQPSASLDSRGIEYGQYDAIVVAAGAAAATIEEVEQARLPLQLCQGFTLVMRPPPSPHAPTAAPGLTPATEASSSNMLIRAPGAPHESPERTFSGTYPPGSPSLLGQPYIAAQGSTRLVVGATKSYGWTSEAALAACRRSEFAQEAPGLPRTASASSRSNALDDAGEEDAGGNPGSSRCGECTPPYAPPGPAAGQGHEEQGASVEALRAAACCVWAPLTGWRIGSVREGIRALPPRTTHGSLPLLGRLAAVRPWWLVAGLGSRGLVYHGWLARLIADAVLCNREDEIPRELTAWREVDAGSALFEAP